MAVYPGAIWPVWQWFDANGDPLAGGKLYTYSAGTVTPRAVYTDVNLTVAATNPVILDSDGRAEFYLQPNGYKFNLTDSNDVQVAGFPVDNIEDVGQTFASIFGTVLATGATNVTSGYTVLVTDHLVTVSSTGGPTPCVINLPVAATATQPVTIKNVGLIALAVTPNGADLIETANAAYTVPAYSGSMKPSIVLVSDHVSSWWILASHGLG